MPDKRASAPYVTLNEMPADRVTDREGRWHLRHARLDDGAHVFVCSARAAEGTRASDLVPETLDVLPGDDWDGDELSLSVAALRAVMEWPPGESRPIWRTRNLLRCKPFGINRYGRPAWLVAASLLFEPRDLWIGVYWTVPDGSWPQRIDVYICPLPTLVLKVVLRGNAR